MADADLGSDTLVRLLRRKLQADHLVIRCSRLVIEMMSNTAHCFRFVADDVTTPVNQFHKVSYDGWAILSPIRLVDRLAVLSLVTK